MENRLIHCVRFFIIPFAIGFAYVVNAQDAQFTQFYAAPTYLNPAFAGAIQCWRAGLNYRNQWSFGVRSYNSVLASADYNFRRAKLGLGGYVLYDTPGAGGFTTFEFAPIIAKEIKIKEDLRLRFGLQPSYHFKYLTAGNYTFGDQYSDLQRIGATSDAPNIVGQYNFFDISSGALIYSDRFWIGIAIHHMMNNRLFFPANSILYVPTKISLHGGMKFELRDEYESKIKPVVQIKNQGNNFQADLGVYYERNNLVFGAWYRGIPILNSSAVAINQDAIALMFGIKIQQLQLGYSYDLPISRMIYTFGSHELSAIFEFCFETGKRKPPRSIQMIPCPVL